MTRVANLSVVLTDVPPALSPAREQLAKAMAWRETAQAALGEIIRQHQRVERLGADGADEAAIRAKIAALEGEHAALIEEWMMVENAARPVLPHVRDIADLQKQLQDAQIVAASARAALVRVNEEMVDRQADCADAIERIKACADGVLVETAETLAAELELTERRAALVRGELMALQRHFEIEGQRGRSGGAAAAVMRAIPKGPYELAEPSINLAVTRWRDLAGRLVSDENAELEESRNEPFSSLWSQLGLE